MHPDILDPSDPDPERRARLSDWLQLQWQLALTPARARVLLAEEGDPARAWRREPARAPAGAPVLERWLRALVRTGTRLVPWGSPAYPERLAALPDAAPVLGVRGDVASLARPAVALVGPRAPSAYGLATATALAAGLARRGVVVVSGLARGVDAAAHEAALRAGGQTVAVQACGPDQVYPPEHADLALRIERAGAVVSEQPPGTPPRGVYFPLRNRLISGLSRAVVVVEARVRSGSLVTARHALEQGVDVLAVPGPIDAATSVGCNRLLRDGAAPVLGVADVLAALGDFVPDDAVGSAAAAAEVGLDAGARAILRALRRAPATRDELARSLRQSPGDLAAPLLELELRGLVRGDRSGRLRAVSGALA